MKKVWITALTKDEKAVQNIMKTVQTYGLRPEGHFWVDDLKRMAWTAPLEDLLSGDTALWVIAGAAGAFTEASTRLGLSLLAIALHAGKGHGFPILIVPLEGDLRADALPTPLRSAEVMPPGGAAFGAKVVARANAIARPMEMEYRLDVHPIEGIGLWFEVGPAQASWSGAMFGVSGGEIDFHGVGPRGRLPEKAVLEYPSKGLKLNMGGDEFTAWAVKNTLSEGLSYFVRVKGEPKALIFGAFPEEAEADVYSVTLK